MKALSPHHTIYGLDIISPVKEGVVETFTWDNLDDGSIPEIDAIIHLAGKAHDTKNKSAADRYFIISKTTKIGDGMYCSHPYSTIINAKSIVSNFSCRQLTTIGNKFDGMNNERPTIGNNVSLGANVSIIGNITIGDNVVIGAGTIVVKDVPSDSIVVGNPARIINKREI